MSLAAVWAHPRLTTELVALNLNEFQTILQDQAACPAFCFQVFNLFAVFFDSCDSKGTTDSKQETHEGIGVSVFEGSQGLS